MRKFEVRTIVIDKYNEPTMLVCMDLETYNEALCSYIEHLRDECFNAGFNARESAEEEE